MAKGALKRYVRSTPLLRDPGEALELRGLMTAWTEAAECPSGALKTALLDALDDTALGTFSPAISFFVKCKTQEEVDELWEKLSEGGEKQRCGWLTDKFGVSWQIVPSVLGEMLQDKDTEKSRRVMEAMLHMDKIDIERLKQAYNAVKR